MARKGLLLLLLLLEEESWEGGNCIVGRVSVMPHLECHLKKNKIDKYIYPGGKCLSICIIMCEPHDILVHMPLFESQNYFSKGYRFRAPF